MKVVDYKLVNTLKEKLNERVNILTNLLDPINSRYDPEAMCLKCSNSDLSLAISDIHSILREVAKL